MSSSLCQSFHELAALTCRRMDAAALTGLSWNEETNTETLLLELRERHPTQIAIAAFTKPQEAKNGADWEWWIHDAGRWLGMRVQAKRTIKGQKSFYGLRTYKAKKQPNTQVDTLIQEAHRDGLFPVYCFYVSSLSPPWSAPNGCMVGHAEAVRSIPSSKYSHLAKVVFPWQFLVCPGIGGEKASPFHTGETALMFSLRKSGLSQEIRGRASPPQYVRSLLDAPEAKAFGLADAIGRADGILAQANASERRIRGIVVIDTRRRGLD